jgi:NAD-dependent deacetylase
MRQTIAAAAPNPGHLALVRLEAMGLLKYLITQNVDNLHRRAGSQNLLEIHGNSTLIRCIQCTSRYAPEAVSLDVLPPSCPQCSGMLKIDTVSFGEPIPPDVLTQCHQTSERCDCMMVIGTSATVYPAAWFPMQVRERGGALIEVNLYESELTPLCTVSLRGKAGEILPQLVEAVQALGT